MTPEKFKGIIRAVITAKEASLSSFGDAKLNALAREYSAGKTDIAGAIATLQSLFADNFKIDRHDYDEIEKRLERS